MSLASLPFTGLHHLGEQLFSIISVCGGLARTRVAAAGHFPLGRPLKGLWRFFRYTGLPPLRAL